GHHSPLGSPEHLRAIGAADANVARVLAQVDALDPSGEAILFAVCSDHGMQTIRRRIDLDARLVEAGFKAAPDSREFVVAPQGTAAVIHAAPEARHRVPRLLRWMATQDFAGEVLHGAALARAGLPTAGTLVAAVSLAGDDEPNAHGVRGRSDVAENALGGESLPGHGHHGGLG